MEERAVSRRPVWRAGLAAGILAFAAGLGPARAQEGATLSDPAEGAYPLLLDGTLSGGGDLKDDAAPHSGLFRFPTALEPWERFKGRAREATGVSFGGSWGLLWQSYSDEGLALPDGRRLGERDAVGQKFTLNLSRDLWRSGTREALTLDVVVEDRGPVGTELNPLQGGVRAGSIVPTAATWGAFDLGVTQVYIRQNLAGNRFQYTIGKIFAPNYINAYPFFDDNRQFLNQTFSTSPTIPSPLRGFGAVAVWYPTETGAYVQGGVFTPNSDDTGWTADSFFEDGEFFYNLEIGWSGLARTGTPLNARGPMDTNNVHLSFWRKDEQENGGPVFGPEARGVAFNANFMAGDDLMWFLRGGWSDGYPGVDRNLTAGFGWRPGAQFSDLFGFGIGWARPSDDLTEATGLAHPREQYTAEWFYRFHVTPNFAVTPDLQVVLDPTLNPDVEALWVLGLRARATF